VLLVLPPSETKRDGGDATPLDLTALGFPALAAERRQIVAALKALSRSVADSTAALRLGSTQRSEIDRNRAVASSPTMPALDRYTGVLYDGLEVTTLSTKERAFAHDHVVIHSALFGLVRAGDPIPAYRLSHDARLPGISLRRHWSASVTRQLAEYDGLVLDLRSEAYAKLGPAPPGAWYVRVLSEDARGRRLALSHFNKKSKGEFARAIVEEGADHATVESLIAWATASGIRLERGAVGELDLVV